MLEGFSLQLLCIHNVGIETLDLHGQILCVSEDLLSELLCVHIMGIYMCLKASFCSCFVFTMSFDLHGLILSVSEGLLSELLCNHNVCRETLDPPGLNFLLQMLCIHIVDIEIFYLHGLILCVLEGYLSELLEIDNVCMGTFALHGQI